MNQPLTPAPSSYSAVPGTCPQCGDVTLQLVAMTFELRCSKCGRRWLDLADYVRVMKAMGLDGGLIARLCDVIGNSIRASGGVVPSLPPW